MFKKENNFFVIYIRKPNQVLPFISSLIRRIRLFSKKSPCMANGNPLPWSFGINLSSDMPKIQTLFQFSKLVNVFEISFR